jgi:hypothetical protein
MNQTRFEEHVGSWEYTLLLFSNISGRPMSEHPCFDRVIRQGNPLESDLAAAWLSRPGQSRQAS